MDMMIHKWGTVLAFVLQKEIFVYLTASSNSVFENEIVSDTLLR